MRESQPRWHVPTVLTSAAFQSSEHATLAALVSAVDSLARSSALRVNRGRNGFLCGSVELTIRRWVNIIAHRYKTTHTTGVVGRLKGWSTHVPWTATQRGRDDDPAAAGQARPALQPPRPRGRDRHLRRPALRIRHRRDQRRARAPAA